MVKEADESYEKRMEELTPRWIKVRNKMESIGLYANASEWLKERGVPWTRESYMNAFRTLYPDLYSEYVYLDEKTESIRKEARAKGETIMAQHRAEYAAGPQ